MKLLVLVFVQVIFTINISWAQPYYPGDYVPKDEIIKLLFDGKLTVEPKALYILDFWGFNCASCLSAFPKMEEMQKRWGEKIQIFLVNENGPNETDSIFRRRPFLKRPNLPLISGNEELEKWFPHFGEPFHVWLDSNFRVTYWLDGYNTNDSTIMAYIKKWPLQLPNRIGKTTYVESLLSNRWVSEIKMASYISKCLPGIHLQSHRISNGQYRYTFNCLSIEELFRQACTMGPNSEFNHPGQLIFDEDLGNIVHRASERSDYLFWLQNFSYNYQLIIPKKDKAQAFSYMESDLCRYFGLEVKEEERSVPVWVIQSIDSSRWQSYSDSAKKLFYQADKRLLKKDSLRYFYGVSVEEFSRLFTKYFENALKCRLLIEIPENTKIRISFPGDIIDHPTIENLKEAFKNYGLVLQSEMRVLKIKVVRKKETVQ